MNGQGTSLDQKSTIPIVLVNWNGYTDTVECLESVLNLTYSNYHVHVIDNASDQQEGERLQKKFEAEVYIDEKSFGKGLASSKKNAEKMAAKKAWDRVQN